MSEQNANGQQPVSPPFQLTCTRCQHQFSVTPPPNLISNEVQVSSIIVPHLDPDVCPRCGATFMPTVARAQVALQWVEVPASQLPSKIVKASRLMM